MMSTRNAVFQLRLSEDEKKRLVQIGNHHKKTASEVLRKLMADEFERMGAVEKKKAS